MVNCMYYIYVQRELAKRSGQTAFEAIRGFAVFKNANSSMSIMIHISPSLDSEE